MLMDRDLPIISDDTDRLIALRRIAELSGAIVSAEEKGELIALADAVALYDALKKAAGSAANDNLPRRG
ncbi:hypothetical protein [Bosea sp. BK604]|uniref:hypothetical protein n=1 Tax=Bosea sp. BK604 TaxID=2512180 RepID=UPI001050BD51|nr:hypothetical protein [Bosea sp. BK604]TCR65663.1 hypothetical protein EV560_105426 [Bosea sp. BK604]